MNAGTPRPGFATILLLVLTVLIMTIMMSGIDFSTEVRERRLSNAEEMRRYLISVIEQINAGFARHLATGGNWPEIPAGSETTGVAFFTEMGSGAEELLANVSGALLASTTVRVLSRSVTGGMVTGTMLEIVAKIDDTGGMSDVEGKQMVMEIGRVKGVLSVFVEDNQTVRVVVRCTRTVESGPRKM